jgi:hypothetical protein
MSPDVSDQIANIGLRSNEIATRVQMLGDAEVLYIQQQIMNTDLQSTTAAGLTKAGKIMTIIGISLAAAGAIAMATNWDKELDEGSGEEGVSVAWKGTGAIWLASGAVLTIIGLTRRK